MIAEARIEAEATYGFGVPCRGFLDRDELLGLPVRGVIRRIAEQPQTALAARTGRVLAEVAAAKEQVDVRVISKPASPEDPGRAVELDSPIGSVVDPQTRSFTIGVSHHYRGGAEGVA
jgi:hypothetical protein